MKNLYVTVCMLITVGILASGCQTAAKAMYGVKSPRLESRSTIATFASKNKIDTTRICYFKDFNHFAKASEMKILSFPDAIFFNGEGNFVNYRETPESCNAAIDGFIADLQNFDRRPSDPSRTLESMLELTTETTPPSANITVFITFAKFAGNRVNREKAFEWVRLLENARANGVNVQYYLLNCDFQESWNIPRQLHKNLGIKS